MRFMKKIFKKGNFYQHTMSKSERNLKAIAETEKFVAQEFEKHPHYSFNDWTVMYNHSIKARDLALQICEGMSVDTTVVAIGALLHDIGKTYGADAETLHTKHEEFNLSVSEEFLDTLGLPKGQLQMIKEVVSYKSDGVEMKVIKDADALAFYADKKLYMMFIDWARENKLNDAIQRKLGKFTNLNFEQSKKLGIGWYRQMKEDWKVYRKAGSYGVTIPIEIIRELKIRENQKVVITKRGKGILIQDWKKK